jgi:hypothetical protein
MELLETSALKEGAVVAVGAGKTEPQKDVANRNLGKEGTAIHR